MKMFTTSLLIFLAVQELAGADIQSGLQVEKNEEGYLISENGTPVLFYQRKMKSNNGTHPRANYVHPLFDLEGKVLTQDFPSDHLHHRGVFWTWHQTTVAGKQMGDPWLCKEFEWDVTKVVVDQSSSESVSLIADVLWKSPHLVDASETPIPFASERVVIRVHQKENDRRHIDFEIQLLALRDDVEIGGDAGPKGYGGFSPRFKLPKDLTFTSDKGDVEATVTATAPAPWMCFTGSFTHQTPTSVGLLCHPSNPSYPEPWILRNRSKSMQNPVDPGREPVALTTDANDPLELKYRLVIFSGEADQKTMAEEHQRYQRVQKLNPKIRLGDKVDSLRTKNQTTRKARRKKR